MEDDVFRPGDPVTVRLGDPEPISGTFEKREGTGDDAMAVVRIDGGTTLVTVMENLRLCEDALAERDAWDEIAFEWDE